jgi:hypothetical protein
METHGAIQQAAYEPPSLRVEGSVRDLTHGSLINVLSDGTYTIQPGQPVVVPSHS